MMAPLRVSGSSNITWFGIAVFPWFRIIAIRRRRRRRQNFFRSPMGATGQEYHVDRDADNEVRFVSRVPLEEVVGITDRNSATRVVAPGS